MQYYSFIYAFFCLWFWIELCLSIFTAFSSAHSHLEIIMFQVLCKAPGIIISRMWSKPQGNHSLLGTNTGTPRFTALHFVALCGYCVFYELKVCGNPVSSQSISQSIGSVFSTAFAHFVLLCHILVTLAKFHIFSLLVYLLW